MENYDSIFAPKKQDNAKSYAPFDKEAFGDAIEKIYKSVIRS
jgi:hypothetical protein